MMVMMMMMRVMMMMMMMMMTMMMMVMQTDFVFALCVRVGAWTPPTAGTLGDALPTSATGSHGHGGGSVGAAGGGAAGLSSGPAIDDNCPVCVCVCVVRQQQQLNLFDDSAPPHASAPRARTAEAT